MKTLKCVKCGSKTNKGGWISVNVYDGAIGRGKGVECGRDDCKIKKGSPAYVKFYWYKHFLQVALQPDWFADYAYQDFWNEIKLTDPKTKVRLPELVEMLKRKWGKPVKKWWQFWKV